MLDFRRQHRGFGGGDASLGTCGAQHRSGGGWCGSAAFGRLNPGGSSNDERLESAQNRSISSHVQFSALADEASRSNVGQPGDAVEVPTLRVQTGLLGKECGAIFGADK